MAQDGIDRQASEDPTEHRELWTVDPPMAGRDVANLQRACADRLRARGISSDDVPIAEHGKFTFLTALAAIEAQYFLGLRSDTYLKRDAEEHLCVTVGAQQIIRNPGGRSEVHLQRARDRQGQLDRGPRYYDDLAGGGGGGEAPRIVTAKEAGLRFINRWGGKGNIYRGAWHWTAGPRASGVTDLLRLGRQYHAYHQSMGWPGLSYETLIADDGTILFANPISIKSAGVASNNSGLVNICCPGTTGDRLTAAQKDSVKWLRSRWHTRDVPSTHRLPRSAAGLAWRPHNEFPGQSTACPGSMARDYKEAWR